MGPEFSVPPAILAVMERWACLQPLAALPVDLHGVEAVWKRLDLAGLYRMFVPAPQRSVLSWQSSLLRRFLLGLGKRPLYRSPLGQRFAFWLT